MGGNGKLQLPWGGTTKAVFSIFPSIFAPLLLPQACFHGSKWKPCSRLTPKNCRDARDPAGGGSGVCDGVRRPILAAPGGPGVGGRAGRIYRDGGNEGGITPPSLASIGNPYTKVFWIGRVGQSSLSNQNLFYRTFGGGGPASAG